MRIFKELVQKTLSCFGYSLRSNRTLTGGSPGNATRPIADLKLFLEDLRSRGFMPQGVVDVGAHKGDWTATAFGVFPEARYLLVEPQAEMQSYLAGLQGKCPAVYVLQAGLAEADGELVQTIWDDFAGSSFLPLSDSSLLAAGKQRKTPVFRLDKYLAGHLPDFHPDLLKLDVQGFELEVLRGAESILPSVQLIVMETSLYEFEAGQPLIADVFEFMRRHDFVLYDVPGFARRPLDGALGQLDLAFVPRESHLRQDHKWTALPE